MVTETLWILSIGFAIEVFSYIDSISRKNCLVNPKQSYSKNVENDLTWSGNKSKTETILDPGQHAALRSLHHVLIYLFGSFAYVVPTIERLHCFVHLGARYVFDIPYCVL